MALPKVESVIFEISLPGVKDPVKYRPFTMKEYKALLQSREFGDDMGFVSVVESILTECTFGKIDIGELPIYVVDWLYLIIHGKSKGEIVVSQYHCLNPVSDPETGEAVVCDAKFKVEFNLTNSFINFPPEFFQKCIIELNDEVGMRLKSPSFSKFRSVGVDGKGVFDLSDDYIYACVECIYEGDKILIPNTDFTFEELKEFIDQFPASKIEEITNFFKNQPYVCLRLNLKCPKCGNQSLIELRGIADFFD